MDYETQRKLDKLAALEAFGVDNWEGYGEALEGWCAEGQVGDLIGDTVEALTDALIDNIDHEYPAGPECGASYHVTADEEFEAILRKFLERYKEIINA